MHSIKVDAFFSCSFDAADEPINSHFMAICRALGFQLTNVSTGSAGTPPEVAKKKISSSQALIAVCTQRSEFKSGGYAMPQAVHDEISFAYGKDIPVLMIVEDGVDLLGFKSNFGTYLSFKRGELISPDRLEKAIEAIHELKMEVLEPHHIGGDRGISECHADYIHHMVELKCDGGNYLWNYNTSKKLVYTNSTKRGFQTSAWATVPPDVAENTPPMEWQIELHNASRGIKLDVTVEKQTPHSFDAVVKLVPPPEEGDFIEYRTAVSSRYMNALWDDEVPEGSVVHLEDGDFKCADGLTFIHRTKKAVIEFRFPKEYGFSRSDLRPFVGSYTSSVDYEVLSELERAKIRVDEFGGNLVYRIELDSPLPGHLYGIAWNPRPRPATDGS
jgi:hypothetical protein